MKFKERPEGRILEKGNKQNRYERAQQAGDDGRNELKLPRPKNPVLVTRVCLYCGNSYPADFKAEICPKCSTPF